MPPKTKALFYEELPNPSTDKPPSHACPEPVEGWEGRGDRSLTPPQSLSQPHLVPNFSLPYCL